MDDDIQLQIIGESEFSLDKIFDIIRKAFQSEKVQKDLQNKTLKRIVYVADKVINFIVED